MNLTEHLLHLEERLLSHAIRSSLAHLSALLAADFHEIGSSGRTFSRAEILEALAAESPQSHTTLTDFRCTELTDTLAHVTYRTVHETGQAAWRTALRSSLWIFRDDRWQILFHQGTRVP